MHNANRATVRVQGPNLKPKPPILHQLAQVLRRCPTVSLLAFWSVYGEKTYIDHSAGAVKHSRLKAVPIDNTSNLYWKPVAFPVRHL